jgi:hypothetical protein
MDKLSQDKIDELEKAAKDYFSNERIRLDAQWKFLDAISKKRGGSVGMQDSNAYESSQILSKFITDYLSTPLGAKEEV